MGKSEIVMRVAKEFITKHRAILPKMKEDAEASRFGELQEAAHALKGGAWNLDAVFLGTLAAFTEAGAKLGDASVCIHYVEKMESAMDEFEQAIGQ
jgi:HPt (histidine-containing phosphotransfer) domain-containing protein